MKIVVRDPESFSKSVAEYVIDYLEQDCHVYTATEYETGIAKVVLRKLKNLRQEEED
jgi:hypothetical protein